MNTPSLSGLVTKSSTQDNPISTLRTFLDKEERFEQARNVEEMRFVGYVLELSYETARIITSDPYKLAVGGFLGVHFLILVPDNSDDLPPHFTLLRVTEVSLTPLSNQVHKPILNYIRNQCQNWMFGHKANFNGVPLM